MTSLASVQINQLRLRGDTRAKTALLASLDSQIWPGEYDPRIIFINRLQVKSPWWMLARELAQQSEVEYRTAVTALQASAASNAVVFASESNLVVQILVNLMSGQTPWYQQTWLAQTQLTAEPIAVLLHRPALVPEVLQQLNQRQMLADFFVHCTETDLQRLLTSLQNFLVIDPRVNSVALVYPASFSTAAPSTNSSASMSKKQLPLVQLNWAENWLPLLLTPARNKNSQQLVLQLITCLGLWRFSPQQLRTPAAWLLWLGAVADKASAMNLLLAGSEHASQLSIPQAPLLTSSAADNSAQSDSLTVSATNGLTQVAGAVENDNTPSSTSLQVAAEIFDHSESADEFATGNYRSIQQAGFLYFINWLRDFDGISNLPAPFSPWLWLALLQRDCCRVWQVPLDESLQELLLEIGGLSEQDLYESDDEFVVTSLHSAREFLHRRMRDFHLEHCDWLAVPAQVQLEQAYLQVYLHESAVRLDLRLAGLDLNPGWVPWLGRVIYFHFGQYPESLREHI